MEKTEESCDENWNRGVRAIKLRVILRQGRGVGL